MARFHPLKVTDVRRETRDAVVVTLMPREEDHARMADVDVVRIELRRLVRHDGRPRACPGLRRAALRFGLEVVHIAAGVAQSDGKGFGLQAHPEHGHGQDRDDPSRHGVSITCCASAASTGPSQPGPSLGSRSQPLHRSAWPGRLTSGTMCSPSRRPARSW